MRVLRSVVANAVREKERLVDFIGAIKNGFRNDANASGRATRSELWCWTLLSALVAAPR